MIFLKHEVAQNNGNFWATFVKANLLNLHLNRQFQSMVCCRYFKVSKVVCCRYFGLF
jgi:hypothetical protein